MLHGFKKPCVAPWSYPILTFLVLKLLRGGNSHSVMVLAKNIFLGMGKLNKIYIFAFLAYILFYLKVKD